MTAYYNEFDPFAAKWLQELMDDELIAPGHIDNRDIWDVTPQDLKGYTQCHFFAGIGIWSLALRLSGWPDDRPVWSGSAPCQPFSAAGKNAGFDDERHLWPAWHWLITNGKPDDVPVIGEQVASKGGRAWFDLVSGDMEALDHACGAVDTSAAGNGAPFIGQRLYWLASTHYQGSQGWQPDQRGQGSDQCAARSDGMDVGLAQTMRAGWPEGWTGAGNGSVAGSSSDSRLAQTPSGQPRQTGSVQSSGQYGCIPQDLRDCGDSGIPLRPADLWSDADWLLCRDPNGARFRPVEPSTLVMADGRAVRWRMAEGSGTSGQIETHFPLAQAKEYLNRLDEVRGAGNALNIGQAANFISAVMEYLDR